MLDACTVVRRGAPSTNASTGAVTVSSTTVYTGKCKVQTFQAYESRPEVAGRQATVQRYQVHFPVGAFVPAAGDVVTITASAGDSALVGRVYRLAAPFVKSQASAMRCFVDEVIA